jgi:hypothetical protein
VRRSAIRSVITSFRRKIYQRKTRKNEKEPYKSDSNVRMFLF